jgi:type I restriction-modification system DNA methylase subunit
MGTAPVAVKSLVDRFDQNRDAADGSQLTAYSLRLDSDSGPSAASRKPIADVLGEVYEQFLGKVIKLTDGHRAKVEEKPEVRKAGGVYYTPTYVVDYIVKNTVSKLHGHSTPAHLTNV